MRGDNSIALVRRRKFRLLSKNVARKENQEECVAPTTARSPGRPPGCALMVASDKRSRLQPISKGSEK
jgi:hypothetical protein